MGAYRTYKSCVRMIFHKKYFLAIGVLFSPLKVRLQKNMRSRVRGDRAWAFWFRPRIRAALIEGNWKLETAELFVLCEAVFLLFMSAIEGCQEHFSDPKGPIGKWSNFDPPLWNFSRSAGRLIVTSKL